MSDDMTKSRPNGEHNLIEKNPEKSQEDLRQQPPLARREKI